MDTPKSRSPRKAKAFTITGGTSARTRKRTIILTAKNDRRLSVLAALRDIDRSAIVNELLDVHLAGVLASAPGFEAGKDDTAA